MTEATTGGSGVMRGLWRRLLACTILAALVVTITPGCGQRRIERVVALLNEGKSTEALAQAQKLADSFDDDEVAKRTLAAALVRWADGRPVRPWPGGGPDYKDAHVTASVYLQAGLITPDMPEVYIGLGRLSETIANGEPYDIMGIASRVVDIWQSCPDPDALMQSSPEVRTALIRFVRTGGSYDLRAKCMPDDVDAQYWAAVYAQMNGRNEDARQYAQRVRALLGDTPEARTLLGYVGAWPATKIRISTDRPVDVESDIWPIAIAGRWLYYQCTIESSRAIKRLPLDGGKAEELVRGVGAGCALSPDGQTLYYAPFRIDKPCPVVALNLNDMTRRDVTEVKGEVNGLSVSPDGTKLAITGRDGLSTCATSGGNLRMLVPSRDLDKETIAVPHDPPWSADGRYIAYSLGYYESSGPVVIIDAESGEELSRTEDNRFGPAWEPGQAALRFYYTYSECQSSASAIHLVTLRDGRIASDKVLVDGKVSALASGWSPDGRYILMQLGPPYQTGVALPQPQLWAYDTHRGELLLLAQDRIRCAAVAEDGTIYCVTADGRLIGLRIGD